MAVLGLGAYLFSAAVCARAGQPATGVEKKSGKGRCSVLMRFGNLLEQQVTIEADRVKGPDFNLTREGDVWYGFIRSRPTRFRTTGDEISGNAAGLDLMLHLFRKAETLRIRGLVGGRRVSVDISGIKVRVDAGASGGAESSTHLVLELTEPGRYKGQFGQGATIAPAELVASGCDLAGLKSRPGLVVALFLWWLGN
ncbi:MAG: hypothetical protein D6806_07055 [Deltaproteobacteria bacterium]|nr:MAG: hypothetical protein D6806_07055 [Deltaproteobacteria bacterium]